mgnify:CR=1 FL=1
MYFLYSLGGVTFNKCWITLSILNWYSPNFQWFILMTNALNNQVGTLGDMFLWLVATLKQGVIYFIKQALPPNISAGSVKEISHSEYARWPKYPNTISKKRTTLHQKSIWTQSGRYCRPNPLFWAFATIAFWPLCMRPYMKPKKRPRDWLLLKGRMKV